MSSVIGASDADLGRPDPDEQRQRRREEQEEQTARSMAQGAAQQQATTPGANAEAGYWDVIGHPTLEDPDMEDGLEAFTRAELSRINALGNISRADWRRLELRTDNEFWIMKNELRGQDTSLSDDSERLLYGENRPALTDQMARRLEAAREAKKQMLSLSVDARGLKSGTEIHAVARTEDPDEDEDGGLFGGLGNYLSG